MVSFCLIGHLHWDSARAASRTSDRKYYITSPNCDFVPEPFVGRVVIAMRADYRYGPPDLILWPQVLLENFEYLSAIPRKVAASDPRAPIWSDPREDDFRVIQGCEFKTLGLFKSTSLQPFAKLVYELSQRIGGRPGPAPSRLKWLDAAMRQACDRLHRFPSTYRDACVQYRETQRYWLMATAFLEYDRIMASMSMSAARPPRLDLMGAFTTHAHAVQQLFAAGIPVWFIRSDASVVGMHLNTCHLTPPSNIITTFGPGGGHELYTGLSGPRHLQCTACGGHNYIDVSHAPLLAVYEDAGYAPPAKQKTACTSTTASDCRASGAAARGGSARGGSARGSRGALMRATPSIHSAMSGPGPVRSTLSVRKPTIGPCEYDANAFPCPSNSRNRSYCTISSTWAK